MFFRKHNKIKSKDLIMLLELKKKKKSDLKFLQSALRAVVLVTKNSITQLHQ